MREVGDEIDFGDGGAGTADARGVVDEAAAEIGEDAFFDFDGALLGGEDFGFVVLELRSGEALGVDEGLLAFVVGGGGGEVGFGDLDVVAEDGIEADFERADAGAAALAVLDGGDGGSTGRTDGAEVVEFGVDAGGDDSAFGEGEGRLGDEGGEDDGAEVFEGVEGGAGVGPEGRADSVQRIASRNSWLRGDGGNARSFVATLLRMTVRFSKRCGGIADVGEVSEGGGQ